MRRGLRPCARASGQTAAEARIDPATIKPSAAMRRSFAAAASQAPRGPSAADVEAMQRMSPEERQQAIRGMVEGLAARLEAQPNDPEGWRRLGRAWRTLGERDKAKAAYAKAAELMPDRVDVLSDYAGALLDGVAGESPAAGLRRGHAPHPRPRPRPRRRAVVHRPRRGAGRQQGCRRSPLGEAAGAPARRIARACRGQAAARQYDREGRRPADGRQSSLTAARTAGSAARRRRRRCTTAAARAASSR